MPFFKIIVPNYNNAGWLDKCLGSVKNQTYHDYGLVFVDDCSTDDSRDKAEKIAEGWMNALLRYPHEKRYNGGSRNLGLEYYTDAKYTLFLDSDDWFVDENVLQDLHDFIVEKNYPECIRLPYSFEYDLVKTGNVYLCDNTPEMLVKSCFVACWTKCIKSGLIQPFPENTLMEDVVQHIKQCDAINEVVPFTRPVVVHNRNNTNSITREGNQDLKRGKWQSSMFRYMADLLDMKLMHDYCEKVRQHRIEVCLKNIKNDVYTQSG
jgi:glycosyltransferase involved in cell wall biosynthesis